MIPLSFDFFTYETLPVVYKALAKKQGFKVRKDEVVAVKQVCIEWETCSYECQFYHVGKTPDSVQKFFHKLAKEDGFDLNEVVKKAWGEEE